MAKIKVIVADDHGLFREGVCRILSQEDDIECVGMAGDGEQAIQLAQQLKPQVVLIDVSMPKMDGIKASIEIKKKCPGIAVIILSAYKHASYVQACMEAGIDGYLLKNMVHTELANSIRLVSAGERVYNSDAICDVFHSKFSGMHGRGKDHDKISEREMRIIVLAAKGKTNKEISNELSISANTVGTHFQNIFRKLGVESRSALITEALKKGLIYIEEL